MIPLFRKVAFAGVMSAALLVPFAVRAQDAAAERTLAAQAKLTTALVDRLQPTGEENAIVSPAGVAAVFALLDVGTSDGFREAAHTVLGYDNSRAAVADFEDLREEIASVDHLAGSAGAIFSFANAAVFDPKLNANPDVMARMRQSKAEVSILPLADHATVNAINDWVAKKTNNLIPQIVNDNIADAGLIALNALYFKDDWAVSFDKTQTQLASFRDFERRRVRCADDARRDVDAVPRSGPFRGGRSSLQVGAFLTDAGDDTRWARDVRRIRRRDELAVGQRVRAQQRQRADAALHAAAVNGPAAGAGCCGPRECAA